MHRDELPIAEPCSADWNAMEPRERARFCSACGIEVVDVSAYTESEACELARKPRSGRVCMSYIVRSDGTLRLADTPDVPVRSLFRKGRSLVVAASLALAACGPVDELRTAGLPPEAHDQKPQSMVETDVRIAGGVSPILRQTTIDAGTPDLGAPPSVREPYERVQGEVQEVRLRGRIPAHHAADEPLEP